MELEPRQFWSLTLREFWIKHDAFRRKEDRAESLQIRQALRTAQYKDKDRAVMGRYANRLKRYPIKPWLQSR